MKNKIFKKLDLHKKDLRKLFWKEMFFFSCYVTGRLFFHIDKLHDYTGDIMLMIYE